MYNFGEAKTKVAELVQRSGDDDYKTAIGVWLQLSHKFLADVYDYWVELQDTYNFTTVDGTEDYPLPNRFDKPLGKVYDLTNKTSLSWDEETNYIEGHLSAVADATEGKPNVARIFGATGVTVPISTSGDTVKARSDSASDTGGIVVRVEGYTDSSFLIKDYEAITISTTSPTTFATATTSKTFYKITHVSKSANTTGSIILANSSDTTLCTLPPNERVARHKILRLGDNIPDDAYSMRLPFKQLPYELINDYDYPFTECDRYLILDAWGWALKQDTKDRQAEHAWGKAKEAMLALIARQAGKLGPDYQHYMTNKWATAHRNR